MADTFRLNCPSNFTGSHNMPIGEKVDRRFTFAQQMLPVISTDLFADMTFYHASTGLSYLRVPTASSKHRSEVDPKTLVVMASGVAERDTEGRPRAACSVIFGPEAERNAGGLWPGCLPQTVERAFIVAIGTAADKFERIVKEYPAFENLVILTPSQELVNNMRHRVWDWLRHGFPAQESLPNGTTAEDYKLAHAAFRRVETTGRSIKLWPVDRELLTVANQEAEANLRGYFMDPEPMKEHERLIELGWQELKQHENTMAGLSKMKAVYEKGAKLLKEGRGEGQADTNGSVAGDKFDPDDSWLSVTTPEERALCREFMAMKSASDESGRGEEGEASGR